MVIDRKVPWQRERSEGRKRGRLNQGAMERMPAWTISTSHANVSLSVT